MAQKSLYQSERPFRFEDVKGQDEIVSTLLAKLKKYVNDGYRLNNRNFLFVGPAGTGKTTLARIIAEALNCTDNHDGEPCDECPSCKAIRNGSSQDVIELDAASNNSVDDIRQIIEQVNYAPIGRYKVFILDECHMLSNGATNALLKTLEEPPENVCFIMATTEEDKVPDTIKSRCQIFHLKKISVDIIAKQLSDVCEKYGKCAEEGALQLIAQHSNGGMRNALSILESLFDVDGLSVDNVAARLGITGEDIVFDILDGVLLGDTSKSLSAVQTAVDSGKGIKSLIRQLLKAINDIEAVSLGLSIDGIVNTTVYKQRLSTTISSYQPEIISSFATSLKDVLRDSLSTDADIYMELAIRSCIRKKASEKNLESRVALLEKELADLKSGSIVTHDNAETTNNMAVLREESVEMPSVPDTSSEPSDDVISIEGINTEINVMEDDLEAAFASDFAKADDAVIETSDDTIEHELEKESVSKVEEAVKTAESAEDNKVEKLPNGTQVDVISAEDYFGADFLDSSDEDNKAVKADETEPEKEECIVSDGSKDEPLAEAFNGWLW